MEPQDIRFYEPRDPYYEFSNFYPSPFDLDGERWPTAEQYFQAQKFADPAYRELIRQCDTPNKAFILAHQKRKGGYAAAWLIDKRRCPVPLNKVIAEGLARGVALRPDWEKVKEEVMRRALRAKFTQHAKLRELLLGTGPSRLAEASPRDGYWGLGRDGRGANRLGELLMELRRELQSGAVK